MDKQAKTHGGEHDYCKVPKWQLDLSAGGRDAMIRSTREASVRRAGHYLRELLRHDPYRRLWVIYGVRREREVHQVAVAKALASCLQDHGDGDVDYGQLTCRVSRALRGEVLSRSTLRLFIETFQFNEEHTAALWRQWQGIDLGRVITGELPRAASSSSSSSSHNLPQYETVLLHEFHYLGPDGKPLRHRTLRNIRSLVDGLAIYRYSFDTSDLTVDRIGGGLPGSLYPLTANIWSVDIALSRALDRGEEHLLEFESTFHYNKPVEACFRRAAHERLENVAIRVEFHPDKLPRNVWWTEWRDYREPYAVPISRQSILLDMEHVAYHRLDVLDRAVAGFAWEF
jgi:hypothetical protein